MDCLRKTRPVYAAVLVATALRFASGVLAQSGAATVTTSKSGSRTTRLASSAEFPPQLVNWTPRPGNPIFTAEGPGHWDVKIRERGWILRDGDAWQLWFTGYDGTREGIKMLGYATSPDGVHWTRSPKNPIY